MELQLKEALRRLCAEIGWSYAVFWRAVRRRDQMQLVWEDGYCDRVPSAAPAMSGFEAMDLLIKEKAALRSSQSGDLFAELGGLVDDRVGLLVYKVMASQSHLLGDGIVGEAALTGNHKWIVWDTPRDSGPISKGSADTNKQFLAGIQTIAVIPALPHGVVQLGSTQMVAENSGFINQVRSVFAQLACLPGSFVSNVTQRPLSQNVHQNGSQEIASSVNQSGVSSNYISGFQSVSDILNPQVLKVPDLSTVSQPSSSLSMRLHDNMPANAKAQLATTTTSTIMPFSELSQPTIHPVAKPVRHQHSERESEHVGDQMMLSHPDMRSVEWKILHELSSGSHHQSQILSSSLSSAELTFLEEQLLSISGSQDFGDKHVPILDNSENCHGCKISSSPKNSDNAFPFDQSRSSNKSDNFRKHSSFSSNNNASSCRSRGAILSSLEARQMLDRAEHSSSNHILAGDSQLRCPTSIQVSYALPSERRQIKDDNFHVVFDAGSTIFDEQHSCYGLQPDNKASQLSSLNPEEERKTNGNSDSVDYDACNAPCKQNVNAHDKLEFLQTSIKETSVIPSWNMPGNGLSDLLGFDDNYGTFSGSLDDVLSHGNIVNSHENSANVSTCITQLDTRPVYDAPNEGICDGLFSEASPDQLLDAVIAKISSGVKQNMDDNISCKTSLTRISSSSLNTSPVPCGWITSSEQMRGEDLDLSPMLVRPEAAGSNSLASVCTTDKTGGCSQNDRGYKSHISLWVENGQNLNNDGVSAVHCKRIDEVGKLNKKRPRPAENPRPRPKDRQMIQDRFKELREIVPNGAKCSIDTLLEKTIKHMLFLQSVTNHAEKLKDVGEPKIMHKEGGVHLKDNFKGGATWAIEVGTQSMICPIIVEDLNPPRQMLVEMLCEERGLFLEIADLIRGLGLTILKGLMEARNDKIWARFAVEANRDVTRMEIFLSLVRLLEPNVGSSMVPQGVGSPNMLHVLHPTSIPATGMGDHLR